MTISVFCKESSWIRRRDQEIRWVCYIAHCFRGKSTEKNTLFSIKIDIREINKVDMDQYKTFLQVTKFKTMQFIGTPRSILYFIDSILGNSKNCTN